MPQFRKPPCPISDISIIRLYLCSPFCADHEDSRDREFEKFIATSGIEDRHYLNPTPRLISFVSRRKESKNDKEYEA